MFGHTYPFQPKLGPVYRFINPVDFIDTGKICNQVKRGKNKAESAMQLISYFVSFGRKLLLQKCRVCWRRHQDRGIVFEQRAVGGHRWDDVYSKGLIIIQYTERKIFGY